MKLERYRRQIDLIDAEIVALLLARESLSKEIGQVKASAGVPIVDRAREESVLQLVRLQSDGSAGIAAIYRTILEESRRIQTHEIENIAAEAVA